MRDQSISNAAVRQAEILATTYGHSSVCGRNVLHSVLYLSEWSNGSGGSRISARILMENGDISLFRQ